MHQSLPFRGERDSGISAETNPFQCRSVPRIRPVESAPPRGPAIYKSAGGPPNQPTARLSVRIGLRASRAAWASFSFSSEASLSILPTRCRTFSNSNPFTRNNQPRQFRLPSRLRCVQRPKHSTGIRALVRRSPLSATKPSCPGNTTPQHQVGCSRERSPRSAGSGLHDAVLSLQRPPQPVSRPRLVVNDQWFS